ncbi:MAG: hypothetical protein H7Y30_14885 [Pyrinomonadaceae bacterium]|nr:hypothetical protein [Pyrinomonadaceae bacterium]
MRKLAGAISTLLLIALSSSAIQAQSPNVQFDQASISLFHLLHVTGNFTFAGQGVLVNAPLLAGDGSVTPTCSPCYAGETYALQGNMGSVTRGNFNTLSWASGELWYLYGFQLNSPPIVLPYYRSRLPFTRTLPATLTGALSGYTQSPNAVSNPNLYKVFETPLSFTGTVTVTFMLWGSPFHESSYGFGTGRPFYYVQSIVYDFPSPGAPTE